MSHSHFEEYLTKVTSKVKSKEAREMITKELHYHLNELSQSFQKRGFPEAEANEKAIQEMGDPSALGENLNRLHKPKMDWLLVGILCIVAVLSFLPLIGGLYDILREPVSYFVKRQSFWLSLALLVIIALIVFDYRRLQHYWVYFYLVGVAILIYTYFAGYVQNDSITWIRFFTFSIDPRPLTLFLFFLAWASITNQINRFNTLFKQALLLVLFWIPILLYLILPNYTLSILYALSICVMVAFSQGLKRIVVRVGSLLFLSSVMLITTILLTFQNSTGAFPFLHPDLDSTREGHIYQILGNIFSQAGWFGNGLDHDSLIVSLPGNHTDMAFPYLVYSFGWLFGVILCVLLLMLIARVWKNGIKTKESFGRILIIGGATLLTVPTLWNLLMMLGIVPIIEFSLPFISYGGNMLLFNAAILGLALSVYRRKEIIATTVSRNG